MSSGTLSWKSDQLSAFARTFEGRCLLPSSLEFESATEIYNAMIDKRPALLLECSTHDDVQKAVRFAREHACNVTIKSGGHNLSGAALNAGGITIDISRLRSVKLSNDLSIANVAGGCRLGDIDRATYAVGRTVPLGTVSDTGVGGLALGGGIGWLLPKCGLTCDNIEGLTLVDHRGDIVQANATENGGLFWALKGGGGGNYGVVTEFKFKTYPIKNVTAGSVIFDLKDFLRVGRLLDDINRDNDDTLCAIITISNHAKFGDCLSLDVCSIDNRINESELRRRLVGTGNPLQYAVRNMPFVEFQCLFDSCAIRGMRRYAKSMFIDSISEDFLIELKEHFQKRPSLSTAVFVEEFHGRFNSAEYINSAFSNRDMKFNLHLQGCWKSVSEDKANLEWLDATAQHLRNYVRCSGSYLNYNSASSSRMIFPAATLKRLSDVKKRFDPDSFFQGVVKFDLSNV